ncbi:MAG: HlyD family efflux transporter periplasmic adaptor subunit [Firmicutes bacterium]|nr:HlyD family efflux transporter periplasmic adaptor subunit [Bacillota bacterium]
MKASTKRWIYVGIGVVIVGGAAGFVASRSHQARAAASPAISAYLVETARKGTFEGQVTASGTIAPANEATIEAPTSGQISQVKVSLGQTVAQGQTVATLSNGQTITSPIAGTVVNLNTSTGGYVSAGETIMTVANMKTIYADVTVSEDDIRNVKVGQSVTLTLPALPNKTYSGTVSTVGALGSSGSSGTVSYPVTIKISKPTGILLGMSVNATIDTGTVDNAIYVPTSAIETVNGQAEVLVPEKTLPTPTFGGFGGGAGFGGFGGGAFGGGGGFGGFGGGGFGGSGSSSASAAFHRTATTIPVAKPVVLGLTNGTETQIVSGLSANQQVLVPNPAATTSTTGTSSRPGFGGFGGGFGGLGGFRGFGG